MTTAPRRSPWLILLLVLAAGLVAAVVWRVRHASAEKSAAAARMAALRDRPIPVTAGTVGRRDVPIYLEGLGNVVALKTVAVKTMVDGPLDQVVFEEGQSVRRGQVLAQVDPRPFQIQLQQGEGALARDEAQLAEARLNLERYRQLAAERLVAQQQVDDQAALVGQLEGSVRVDRAAVATARLNLVYARITSPIDGVTGVRIVDPGNIVHPGDTNGIVIVTQVDPIAVIFTLPQDLLTPVYEQLARGPLRTEFYSRDGKTQLGVGRLALIDNQINQATSTIRLKAIAPNPRRLLWPNQFVNARLLLTTRRGALVMPATAVQRGPAGTFVYVIGADATAAPRPVELAGIQGDQAMITGGLEEGDRVVVDGQNQLRPGSRVAPREPVREPARAQAEPRPAGGAGGGGATGPGTAGGGRR